jgi:hypothetical protein
MAHATTSHTSEGESRSPVVTARARLGVEVRTKGANSPEALAARRDLAAAKIEQYVTRVLAEAPPLTAAQCDRIVSAVEIGAAS